MPTGGERSSSSGAISKDATNSCGSVLPPSGNNRQQPTKSKTRRIALLRRGLGLFDLDSSTMDMDQESLLPNSLRSRLYKLFGEIEREFETLYAENLALQQQIEVLNEKLETTTGGKDGGSQDATATETDGNHRLKESAKKSPKLSSKLRAVKEEELQYKPISAGSQISQKLKLTYKTSTNKIVSSFRAATSGNQFCRQFRGHRDGVWEVNCSKVDHQIIGTASADHSARLWWIENGSQLLNYLGHTGSVNSIRFHPKEDLVLTASGDQTCHIWRASVSKPAHADKNLSSEDELDMGDDDGVGGTAAADSSDDKQQPASHDPVVLRQASHVYTGHGSVVIAAEWVAGGNQVVTASWDRTAHLYSADTGELISTFTGHDQELTNVCCHPSQRLVVTASKDTTFRLYDMRDPSMKLNVFQGHAQPVMTAVFAGGDHVVSGSDDRTVKVWDLKNMRSPITTIRTDSAVNRLSVHPGHQVIAIPHDNRHIRLFDLSGQRTGRIPRSNRQGHSRMVCATAWNEKDGATCNLFSCGFDRQVLGWFINPLTKD